MNEGLAYRERLLSELGDSIVAAANFFMNVDENLFDGHQTAREVLSHLVFWHYEYCAISQTLLLNQKPTLLAGSLAQLNEQATCKYQKKDMAELARCLSEQQNILELNLRHLENWNVNFPFKKGCRRIDVAGRICSINNHIRHHLVRQERADHRGEAWIKAYYLDPTD
jgi:hypothetical protein